MAAAEPKPSLVERLFAEHRAALQTFFLRRIRAKADAADLAQEVYVRMLRVSDQDAIRNPMRWNPDFDLDMKEHENIPRAHYLDVGGAVTDLGSLQNTFWRGACGGFTAARKATIGSGPTVR